MLNSVQSAIDDYIRSHVLKNVSDILFFPTDDTVIIFRKGVNRKNILLDVSDKASPSEVVELISEKLERFQYAKSRTY